MEERGWKCLEKKGRVKGGKRQIRKQDMTSAFYLAMDGDCKNSSIPQIFVDHRGYTFTFRVERKARTAAITTCYRIQHVSLRLVCFTISFAFVLVFFFFKYLVGYLFFFCFSLWGSVILFCRFIFLPFEYSWGLPRPMQLTLAVVLKGMKFYDHFAAQEQPQWIF